MYKRYLLSLMMGLGLLASSVPVVFAMEDLDVKIDRMKIKEDKEDITDDRTQISQWEQRVKERRAMRDSAKGNYEGNLSKSGAKHKITQDAKNRYDAAERSVQRAEKKLQKAQESLREDEQELTQAYSAMEKDKRD
jgi:hypothetical protein